MSTIATGTTRRLPSLLRGALQIPWLRFNPLRLMSDNKGVFGVNVGHLWEETELVAGWMGELIRAYDAGAIRPVIAATFPFERAAEAHHFIQDRKNIGKVVLVP